MRYCGPVEWLITTGEEWRTMPDEVFEANLEAFVRQLRAYHAQNSAHRARTPRFNFTLQAL